MLTADLQLKRGGMYRTDQKGISRIEDTTAYCRRRSSGQFSSLVLREGQGRGVRQDW